jgi:hypothetical protein
MIGIGEVVRYWLHIGVGWKTGLVSYGHINTLSVTLN